MEGVAIDYDGGSNLSRYRKLSKPGFTIRIRIGNTRRVLTLEGQRASTETSSVQDFLFHNEGIHHENQRLFLAGEELDPERTLAENNVHGECEFQLKSFVPVLVSSLECPGPMITEVEVCPKRDITVRKVKRRLSDKLGIDVAKQRLYLAADEMTSFSRRRELDDCSLFSRYLPPSAGNSFLELRPISNGKIDEGSKIFFRLPIIVQDARREDFIIAASDMKSGIENSATMAQRLSTKAVKSWLSLELSTAKIIKRDPLVGDVVKLLQKNLKRVDQEIEKNESSVRLKFVRNRIVHGGEYLDEKLKCAEDYQIREEEQLLKVEIDKNEAPERENAPIIPLPTPLHPLVSYNQKGTRYTMSKIPTLMQWEVPSSEELDLGARPRVLMEISAFSHSKLCGSWDVAEHYKTYVEILIEGVFYVGDNAAVQNALHEEEADVDSNRSRIYYAQNFMEITITGPENDRSPSFNVVNENPMRWYRKSADRRKNDKIFWEQTLDRRLGQPPPFRYDTRPVNLPERTNLENEEVTYGHNGHSKLLVNNWYMGKERVSDVIPKTATAKRQLYDATCERGTTISGCPFVKCRFNSRMPDLACEEQRTAFEFRIQTQFYVCTLEEHFNTKQRPNDSEQFTVSARQGIARTKRSPGYSDVRTELTSPVDSEMRTNLAVNLANGAWLKDTNVESTFQ